MIAAGNKPLEWPAWLLMPVVIGYLTMTRSFAYLGFAPIFVGEAILGALLALRPGIILGTWLAAQWRSSVYSRLATLSAVFVIFGFIQCVRGLDTHEFPMISLQNFAFNFYIAFLFAGMWVGTQYPELLPRVMWYLAWVNGIYGIIYVVALGGMGAVQEFDTGEVDVYGQPAGSAIALLALLAYERSPRRLVVPLLLNAFVLLAMQMRAEWISFIVGITALSILTKRISTLFLAGTVLAGILILGVLVDFRIPAPSSRNGVVSSREIVGRAVAAVDVDAAAQLTPNAANYGGTVDWRTQWWKNLLDVTHADMTSTLFGKGYGFPIWDHNEVSQSIVPTPHNIFIFVLVYTGWVGALVFYSLQLCLGRLLWNVARASGQPFGFCFWALMFVWAHFDNKLETPFGAIPFYVITGMALTSAMAVIPYSKIFPRSRSLSI